MMPFPHKARLFTLRHRNTIRDCLYALLWIAFSTLIVWLGVMGAQRIVEANQVVSERDVERQELKASLEAEKRKDEERKAAMNSVCKTDRVKCRIILTRW